MKDLIEALTIFAKYTDAKYPTACDHDVLYVCVGYVLDEADAARVHELGFNFDQSVGSWRSYRFGSC